MTISETAPAKVNLSLHVTGRRADGYHLLDSVVVFADISDRIDLRKADVTTLTVTGPLADGVPTDASNLVMQAAALFGAHCPTHITLHKHLPAAAGIGGGSADAAATLRAMAQLWDEPLPDMPSQLALGADVPVCVAGRSFRMQGIGDRLTALPRLPELGIVLANPMQGVPTGPVFTALTGVDNDGLPAAPQSWDRPTVFEWLAMQRNDLQAPAIQICPAVQDVLDALNDARPALARMSGSGGTCFALFENRTQAESAASVIAKDHPNWWVQAGSVLS